MDHPAGRILIAKYRLESVIGEGAFGRVHLAHDLKLDRDVAIKELHKSSGELSSSDFEDHAGRFGREARVQARFNHANIVHVYELLNPEPGLFHLVMEYVEGGSLKQRLERRPQLSIEEVIRLAGGMLAGLAAVHDDPRDIVHRDLKPSNLLLTRAGQVKISDFGLAQVGDESLRSVGGKPHPGTPAYMSPEQESTSAYLYPASDLFSVGCILFEMLAGVGYKQARRRRQTLGELRPEVPPWLDALITQALAKDPEARPESASEMLHEMSEQGSGNSPRQKAQAQAAEEGARLEAESQAQAEAVERKRREAEERKRKELILELAPGVRMEFVRVPAGEFLMGSDPEKDKNARTEEQPQHTVHLEEYLIGKFPVTNAQYQGFIAANPGHGVPFRKEDWAKAYNWDAERRVHPAGKGKHPVVLVSWEDAAAFCEWASRKAGVRVRLPSEAEWEKAARGTDGRMYPWGDEPPDKNRCNFNNNVGGTTKVGKYIAGASPYGALDMAGNAWEWVADWYDEKYYASSPSSNPAGPGSGTQRVLRGGAWLNFEHHVRSSNRYRNGPDLTGYHIGFRCARSQP